MSNFLQTRGQEIPLFFSELIPDDRVVAPDSLDHYDPPMYGPRS